MERKMNDRLPARKISFQSLRDGQLLPSEKSANRRSCVCISPESASVSRMMRRTHLPGDTPRYYNAVDLNTGAFNANVRLDIESIRQDARNPSLFTETITGQFLNSSNCPIASSEHVAEPCETLASYVFKKSTGNMTEPKMRLATMQFAASRRSNIITPNPLALGISSQMRRRSSGYQSIEPKVCAADTMDRRINNCLDPERKSVTRRISYNNEKATIIPDTKQVLSPEIRKAILSPQSQDENKPPLYGEGSQSRFLKCNQYQVNL